MMTGEAGIREQFELTSVAKAHRVPLHLTAILGLIHASALVLLGHPWIALAWVLVSAPVELVVYRGIGAVLADEGVSEAKAVNRIAWLSALRYSVILGSPVVACWAQPGVGEAIFLCLNGAVVLAGALSQSGYVVKVARASAGPALVLPVVGLAPYFREPEGPGVLLGTLIFLLVGLGALKGMADFAREREAMRAERRRFVAEIVAAQAAADAAREEAEAAADAKSIFLATLSHEIRTPLNGILGLTHITLEGELSPGQRDNLTAVASAGALLQSILNDVLDAGKIEAGKMELAAVPTDVPALINDTARFWRGPAAAKGLELEVEVPPAGPLAMVDPVRLQQVLFNLISNAVKFTSQGVVRIVMAVVDGPGEPVMSIKVSDTGIGLSAEAQDRLFGRFNQADATIAGRYGGSGLGLYVCKNLVGLMGGDIRVESTLGRGSTFCVDLPWAPADAPTAMQPGTTGSLAVLAVDDNPTNRRVVSALLEAMGHACMTAASGEAALDMLAADRFDLVLLDLRMPGLNGEQTLERIRTGAVRPRIPVIALTADAVGWDLEAARASGFDGFVAKPIAVPQLARALAEVSAEAI
jgi:signal transduction histidine kinase/ActR/RegA family two-component response regulator